MMSLATIKIINANRIKTPTAETTFLTFAGISFLNIPSIAMTSKCHPSNPGNGNKLIIPKLTEINPH